MTRPICVHCGAKYGRRSVDTQKVTWAYGEEPPPYRGNGVVIGERYQHDPKGPTRKMIDYGEKFARREYEVEDSGSMLREIWDGESWNAPYKPFCTLRCALAYARKAWRISQAHPGV